MYNLFVLFITLQKYMGDRDAFLRGIRSRMN